MTKSSTVLASFRELKTSPSRKNRLKRPAEFSTSQPEIKKEEKKEEKIPERHLKLARTLLRIYLSCRRKRSTIPFSQFENHPSFKHFVWLAGDFERHQQQTGITVNPIQFIKSQFAYLALPEVYPSHLRNVNRWGIYRSFSDQLSFRVKKTNVDEESMLAHLSSVRQETPEQTLKLLSRSGIFSDQFIMRRLRRRGAVNERATKVRI